MLALLTALSICAPSIPNENATQVHLFYHVRRDAAKGIFFSCVRRVSFRSVCIEGEVLLFEKKKNRFLLQLLFLIVLMFWYFPYLRAFVAVQHALDM